MKDKTQIRNYRTLKSWNTVLLIFLILQLPSIIKVSAYLDCNPAPCPSGYADNGVSCSRSTCIRDCTVQVCKQDWTQAFMDDAVGFDGKDAEQDKISKAFSSGDNTKCYNFVFDASTIEERYVDMLVDNFIPDTYPDCDTESIGGFRDDSQPSTPWFAGMSGYLGNVGKDRYNYLLKVMRGHSQTGSDGAYRSQVMVKNGIYCAPGNAACLQLGASGSCNTNCYGRMTKMFLSQGYYVDTTPSIDGGVSNDNTLYSHQLCGKNFKDNIGADDLVDVNRIAYAKYIVYESTTDKANDNKVCDREHEPPGISNVIVIPQNPNAGQDLFCNFTYFDADGFSEQNSVYEWWKNGVNQDINSQMLSHGNLTPGDNWFCKITPGNGFLFGTEQQSINTVSILDTIQNPSLYLASDAVWNATGFFGSDDILSGIDNKMNETLNSCVPGHEGFCDVELTLSSDNIGVMNLSDFGVLYASAHDKLVSLKVGPVIALNENSTLKILEFEILNDGEEDINDIQWRLEINSNEAIQSSETIASLKAGEFAIVYAMHNFSNGGPLLLKLNASGFVNSRFVSSSSGTSFGESGIAIAKFRELDKNASKVIFGIEAINNLESNITNLGWSLKSGIGDEINSNVPFDNIAPNETVFLFISNEYQKSGKYLPVISIADGTESASKAIGLEIKHIELQDLHIADETNSKRIFGFSVKNWLNSSLGNITWSLDTKNNEIINNEFAGTLGANETLFVFIDHNFTAPGEYNVSAAAASGRLNDYRRLTISVTG